MAAFDVEQFILEVKRRPVLWDTTHPEYNHRQAKVSAWEEVACNIYPDSGEWSNYDKFGKVRDIQKKWKTMRDSFVRELKYEKKVAEGLALAKKRKYLYSYLLEFLAPKKKTGDCGGKQSSSDESSSDGETESDASRTNTSDCHMGMDEGYSSSHVAQFCKTSLGTPVPHDHPPQHQPPEQYSCMAVPEPSSGTLGTHSGSEEKQSDNPPSPSSKTVSTPLPCFTPHPFSRNPFSCPSSTPFMSSATSSTPFSPSTTLEQDDDKMFLLSLLPYFKKISEEQKLEARINVTRVLQDMLYKPL